MDHANGQQIDQQHIIGGATGTKLFVVSFSFDVPLLPSLERVEKTS